MKKICLLLLTFFFVNPTTVQAAPETTLSVTSASSSYAPNAIFYTDVMVNSGSNSIVSSDVIMNFNANHIEVTDVQPGPFLQNASIVKKIIDNSSGELTVGIFTHKENTRAGTGSLLVIKWKAKNTGSTAISFNNQKTLVYGLQEGNVLTATTPKTLTIASSGTQSEPAPTNTPTANPTNNASSQGNTRIIYPTVAQSTGGNQSIPVYSQQNSEPSNNEFQVTDSSVPGTTLPSYTDNTSSTVDKLIATIREVFTPRGNDNNAGNPAQSPYYEPNNTTAPFQPIIIVWIMVLIILAVAIFVGVKMFLKKRAQSHGEKPAPENKSNSTLSKIEST